MTRMMTIGAALAATLLVPLSASVDAQQPDTRDKTIMTFSNAVELPGMRLEAGKYVFRVADNATRNVVQVLSEDEKQMLGQWLFVSAERPEVTGDTVITFRETSAASTPAVQYWYYPGEKIGKEFIYPKDQALRIAARTGATVRTEEGPVSAQAQPQAQATTARPAPQPDPASRSTRDEAVATPQAAPTPAPAPQERARLGAPAAPARETAPARPESTIAQNETVERTELPGTASPFPVLGLMAVLSLLGAAGLRAFRS